MARGFESKAVADQQESAQARAPRSRSEGALEPALATRRRSLELARADVERRLAVASSPAHRQMLERALRALEHDLAAIG